MKKLSEYAKENGLNYKNCWNAVSNGTFPLKTEKNKNGRIFVLDNEKEIGLNKKETSFATPTFADKETSNASTRRNAAATSSPTNEYFHIYNGISPFSAYSGRRMDNTGGGIFPVSEAISLCQKAYWNFSVFRNTIDSMTEFSSSKIFLQGGNAKSRGFFKNFFESVKMSSLQDMFFREYYRSCNVFIYRFESTINDSDLSELNKIYSSEAKKLVLPTRYMIVNPYDVGVQSNIVFGSNVVFFKRLNGYEIHRLRASETPEEKRFFKSLPEETQKQINSGAGTVIIPLDPERLFAVFYHKQDYEPMSVPMAYPVLKDIEWKAEMKHVDMAVARTMQQVVLLINMGYESKDGDYMFDPKAAEVMQGLFASESVGKTLVADFNTKLTWAIPSIGDFLDPKKYEIVNNDIMMGLNYILTGQDSKFSNQAIQVQLFIQRIQQAREAFLDEFLIPEIKRISNLMGFKSYPVPKFEDIDLKDNTEFNRIVASLAQMGVLTPSELFNAIETGRIPTAEESLESQTELRSYKDKGYYQPLVGGPFDQQKTAQISADNKIAQSKIPGSSGRPTNTKTKQSTKKISPRTMKGNLEQSEDPDDTLESYSLSKIKDNLILAANLRNGISDFICKSKKIKKMNNKQLKIVDEISEIIIANESPEDWENSIEKYVKNPINENVDRLNEIDEIASYHGIDPQLASILIASKLNV